jgi:hypothetical protein
MPTSASNSQALAINGGAKAIAANDPARSITTAESGHRSTSVCSLGHMCMKAGKPGMFIKWDPVKERTGDSEIDKQMVPFERGEYSLATTLKRFRVDVNAILPRKTKGDVFAQLIPFRFQVCEHSFNVRCQRIRMRRNG